MKQSLKGVKICFLAGTLGMGGAEKQLYFILDALIKLGAEVSLICNYAGEHWEEPIKALGVKYYTLDNCNSFIQRLRATIKLVRKIKPHFLQSQHFYTSFHVGIAARFAGAVSIGASRGSVISEVQNTGRMGKWCLRISKYFVLNSMGAYQEALSLGRRKDRLFYLPNAIAPERFIAIDRSNEEDRQNITLLALGRMIIEKRFDRFLNLLAALKSQYGDKVRGVLAGDGPELDKLKKQAAGLGLTDAEVTFTGRTSTPELYMAQADIFVLTSDSEGTPNVVLEAMAAGLPVVATDAGNIPFFVEDDVNGYVVPREDAKALYQRIEQLVDDKLKRQTMGMSGRKLIQEKFSRDALSHNLSELYQTIMQAEGISI